jgi:outer membrane protein TolC
MDIATQTEIILRGAGYETWPSTGVTPAVICLENAALIGFVHIFSSADELLARWEVVQQAVLARHSAALRAAGAKAWNVYSVFLAKEQTPTQQRAVERIEENFALTRKIARAGVRTQNDVERALLPLIGVKAQPMLSDTDFQDRLRARLNDVSAEVVTAFLGVPSAEEVAKILAEKP